MFQITFTMAVKELLPCPLTGNFPDWLSLLMTRVHVSSVHWSMLRSQSCVSLSQLLDRVRGLSVSTGGGARPVTAAVGQDSPGAE